MRSTRKEISDILEELEAASKGKRFYDLVQKYHILMTKAELPLDSCEDIRKVYDELMLAEVAAEGKSNVPDGKWFRKGSVSVYSESQHEIDNITALENFIWGFQLGVRIMAERMDENDGNIRNVLGKTQAEVKSKLATAVVGQGG